MTDYKKQYDDKLKAYDVQIRSLPTLTKIIPELTKKRLGSFFRRTSTLLGNVDKGKVRRPGYLVHGNGHLAAYTVSNLDQIAAHAADPQAFIQNIVVPQLDFQRKLEFAIGLPGREYEGFRQEAANEIRSHLEEADKLSAGITEKTNEIESIDEEVSKSVDNIRAKAEETSIILARAEKLRERLEKLDGDARGSDSLEKLMRSVRKKATEAEEIASTIEPIKVLALENSGDISDALAKVQDAESKIVDIEQEASRVLGLASQAGLAKSYLSERSKLEKIKMAYTAIFYIGIGVMAWVAAEYVLPAFERFVNIEGGYSAAGAEEADVWQRTLILAIRSAILAPFVWAIIFTSNRVKKVEILEMDYAEKAAASLAYHGYKSEMEADPSLLERLKNGLLIRFSEHPERLLRKTPPTTEIEAGNGLFRMFSGSGELSKDKAHIEEPLEPQKSPESSAAKEGE